MGLLLHCAGMEVQEIFETLMDPGAPEREEENIIQGYTLNTQCMLYTTI